MVEQVMVKQSIALIGAGQMATALARGLVGAGFCSPQQLLVYDPLPAALSKFAEVVGGGQFTPGNRQAVQGSGIVVLAVKPQHIAGVAEEIREGLSASQLVISLAAGVTLERLCHGLGTQRVVRVMPNTPCLVGKGVSGYALGPLATPEDAQVVQRMMGSVGLAVQVDEPLLDGVTGLSGSGPAFVYLMIEALADGGVRAGLPRATALALAAHTVRGAAEMVVSLGEHPAVLKDRVTSPGGTTIAGLQVLEDHSVRGTLMAAVMAATGRARELGRNVS